MNLKSLRRIFSWMGPGRDENRGRSSRSAAPPSPDEGKTPTLGRFCVFAERVFIAEVLPDRPDVARTVAACVQGAEVGSFDYPLRGSPFDGVTGTHACCYEKNVLKQFPGDAYLRSMGASGYAGISLLDSQGRLNGIIVFADRKPLRDPAVVESILGILASRIAMGIENRRIEDALELSESKYRNLCERTTEGLYQLSMEDRYTSVNPAMALLLGYSSPSELMREVTSVSKQVYADPARRAEVLARVRKEGQAHEPECALVRKDGRRIWVSEKLDAIRGPQGNLLHVAAVVQDLTALKEAGTSGARSRSCLDTVLECVPLGVTLMDARGVITQASPSLESLLGHPRAELLAKSWADLMHPEDRKNHGAWLAKCFDGSRPHGQVEGRFLRKTGGSVPARLTISMAPGEPRGFVGVLEELSDRKRTEEDLRASNQRFQSLFEGAAVGIALLDPDGKVTEANHALAQYLGFPRQEILSKPLPDFTHPDDAAKLRQVHEECVKGGRDHHQAERRFVRKDRSVLQARLTVTTVRGGGGVFRCSIAMVEDLTLLRDADLAMAGLRKELGGAHEKLETAQKRVEQVSQEHSATGRTLAEKSDSLAASQEKVRALEGRIQVAEARLQESARKISATELELAAGSEALAAARQAGRSLDEKLQATEIRLDQTSQKLSETERRLAEESRSLAAGRDAMRTLEGKLHSTEENLQVAEKDRRETSKRLADTNHLFVEKAEALAVAQKAAKALDEKLRATEGSLAQTTQKLSATDRDLAAKSESLGAAQAGARAFEDKLKAVEQRLLDTSQKLSDRDRELDEKTRSLAAAQAAARVLEEKLKASEENLRQTAGKVSETGRDLDERSKSLASAQAAARDLEGKLKVSEESLRQTTQKATETSRELEERTESLAATRDAMRTLEEKLHAAEGRLKELSQRISAKDRELGEKSAALDGAHCGADVLEAKIQGLEKNLKEGATRVSDAVRELDEKSKSLAAAHDAVRSLEGKLREAKSLQQETSHKLSSAGTDLAGKTESLVAVEGRTKALERDLKSVQEHLRAAETRYRSVFNQPGTGVASLDETGRFIEVNGALESLLGFSRVELGTRTLASVVHPADGAALTAARAGCVESGKEHFQAQVRLLNKQGGEIWARVTGSIPGDGSGSTPVTLVLVEDITSWVMSSELSQVNHARFEALCQHTGAGVIVCDENEMVTYVNPALERLLGVANDDLISKPLTGLVHPSDPKADERPHAECVEGKRDHFEVEKCLRRKDGDPVWTRATTSILRGEDGLPHYFIHVFEDRTASRKAVADREPGEAARRSLEQKLHATEEKLADADLELAEKSKALAVTRDAVKALEGKLKAAESRLQETSQKLSGTDREMDEKSSSLAAARENVRILEEKLKAGGEKLQKSESGLKETTRKLTDTDRELDQASKTLAVVRTIKDTLEDKLQAAEKKLEQTARKLADTERELAGKSDSAAAAKDRAHSMEGKLQAAESRLKEASQKLADRERELDEKSKSLAAAQAMEPKFHDAETRLKETSQKLAGRDRELEEKSSLLAAAQGSAQALEAKLRTAEDGLRQSTQKLSGANRELDEKSGSLAAARNRAQTLEEKLRGIEENLQASEARYRSVFNQPAIGVASLAPDGRFTEANSALVSLLGFSRDELLTRSLASLTHASDAGALSAAQAECTESGKEHFQVQLRLLNKQTEEIWARLTGSIARGKGDSPATTLVLVEDITAWVISSELSHVNHARFEALCQHTGAGVIICDENDRITYVNPSLEHLLDVTHDDLVSKRIDGLVHASDSKADQHLHDECSEGKRDHYEVEKCLQRKDGEPVWTRATTSVVRSDDGRPRYYIRVFEDITAQRKVEAAHAAEETARRAMEEKLRAAEEKLRQLESAAAPKQATAPEPPSGKPEGAEPLPSPSPPARKLHEILHAFLTVNIEGRIVHVNSKAEHLLASSHAAIFGKPLNEVFSVERQRPIHTPGRAASPGSPDDSGLQKTWVKRRDGSEHIYIQCSSPLLDGAGKVVGTVLVFQNFDAINDLESVLIESERVPSHSVFEEQLAQEFDNTLGILGMVTNPLVASLNQDLRDAKGDWSVVFETAQRQSEEIHEKLLMLSGGTTHA